MNQEQFDDLTPTPATRLSRRQALKLLASSTIGGLLAIMNIGGARAEDKKDKKAKCKCRGDRCCKDSCCKDGCCKGEAKCKCCKDDGRCEDGCCKDGCCSA